MNKTKTLTLICPDCGKPFETKYISEFDANLSAKNKDIALHYGQYSCTCPHCGTEHLVPCVYDYVDEKLKLKVRVDNIVNLFDYYYDVVKPNEGDGYTYYGVTNNRELITLVTSIEHNLNPIVVNLFLKETILKAKEYLEENMGECDIEDAILSEENGELLASILYHTYDEDDKDITSCDFDHKYYNYLFKRYKKHLKDVWPYYFGLQSADKFLYYINDEDIDEQSFKDYQMELLAVSADEHNRDFIFVPTYLVNTFEPGDHVLFNWSEDVYNFPVDRIFYISQFACPIDVDNMAVAIKKSTFVKMPEGTKEDYSKGCPCLLKALRNFNKKGQLSPENIDNEYVCLMLDMHLTNGDDPSTLEEGQILTPNDYYLSPSITLGEDGPYIKVCINKDINELENTEYNIVSFNDLVEHVIAKPNLYYGIYIEDNKNSYEIPSKELLRYKKDRYMTNVDKVIEILKNLTKEEIEWIGETSYKLITGVYFDKKTPKELKKELSLNDKDLDYEFKSGYDRLIQVLHSKY